MISLLSRLPGNATISGFLLLNHTLHPRHRQGTNPRPRPYLILGPRHVAAQHVPRLLLPGGKLQRCNSVPACSEPRSPRKSRFPRSLRGAGKLRADALSMRRFPARRPGAETLVIFELPKSPSLDKYKSLIGKMHFPLLSLRIKPTALLCQSSRVRFS